MKRHVPMTERDQPVRIRIRIKGTVQGVGFRPFVFALAEELGIAGWVLNDDEGVLIEAEGARLSEFVERIPREAPVLSDPREIRTQEIPAEGARGFRIQQSRNDSTRFTTIPPDTAVCTDCLREVFAQDDRRYRYPFTNCTRCGPRYSITETLPYDRPNTSMKTFPMCPACNAEYGDPRNRRFHAQPNACPLCGPTVRTGEGLVGEAALEETVARIVRGSVVAVKGLGGFHLACDASNDKAVRTLRERKRKSNKPFAVMARDMAAVLDVACPTPAEMRLLERPEAPIVLLREKAESPLSDAVSPGCSEVGIMLPYTPLHHLLFHTGNEALRWLVMTSGNRAEEPITATDAEADEALNDLADHRLTHDRDIVMRSDDSVVRFVRGRSRMIRRARGWVPESLSFPFAAPQVLGCGGMLKGTFTLTRDGRAVMSQHLGDLESAAAMGFFDETLRHLSGLYRVQPELVVHDLHPDYPSSRFAARYGEDNGIPSDRILGVQHHHAHIASVMAEHGLVEPVLGVALDGTGYGADGTIWGGEFLVVAPTGWRRAGRLGTFALPGGEAAIRHPWRAAIGALVAAKGSEKAAALVSALGWPSRFGSELAASVLRLAGSPVGSVPTSSAGRVFDAVAALLGLAYHNTFEGEAAMALEAAAWNRAAATDGEAYPFTLGSAGDGTKVVDWFPCLRDIVGDIVRERNRASIALKFHETVARIVLAMVGALARDTGITRVALSGGVFQNRMLLGRVETLLAEGGYEVFSHEKVPTNDAGISLGQAYIGAARFQGCG